MDVSSKLKHENILSIYGVITNLETIHIVGILPPLLVSVT